MEYSERIPQFLREGFSSYNLRHISSYKIACKKIESKIIKNKMDKDLDFTRKANFFYGRDLEKKAFRDDFDSYNESGHHKTTKCLVISGIDGIGRKSYARDVLKSSEIMEKYYYPLTISLAQGENIDDLIMKISDLGIGSYTIEDISSLNSIDERIEILVDLFKQIQLYQEYLFIEDQYCLVKSSEIVYWLDKALEKIDNSIVLVIITNLRVDPFKYRKNKNLFSISLQELTPSDTAGMLRGYSRLNNMPFNPGDIEFFMYLLTGYPPQIEQCVELAIAESIQYVKDNSYKIAEFPQKNSAKLLNMVIEEEHQNEYRSFLALLSSMSATPLTLINYIIKKNPIYKEILNRLKLYTICNYSGSSGEYIKLSQVISDYVQRSSFSLSQDVKTILNENIETFADKMNDPSYIDYLTFSEFSFYIKENFKMGVEDIPERFLYSTIYVKSIVELYNEQNYSYLIKMVQQLKERDTFLSLDDEAKDVIQFYYCSSLAREKSSAFDEEVTYFQSKSYQQYNFLKGFNYRIQGKFKFAESSYLKVLEDNPRHDKARRELVLIYTNLQDYSTALDLAEQNCKEYSDNMYQIQAYFDCLIHKPKHTEQDLIDIATMLDSATNIHKTKANEMYFQLVAKNHAFIEKDFELALQVLDDGIKMFPKSFYLRKDYFDICRRNRDIKGMGDALHNLKKFQYFGDASYKIAIDTREAFLDAYKGKALISIQLKLKNNNYFTDNAFKNLTDKINEILNPI